jgi:AAA+ ATPase superfamily predicted ATPase
MSQFVGRESDLAFLQEEYAQNRASFVVLYGRKRLGKTTLISEFGRDKDMLYFLATEESESANRREFKSLVAKFTSSELLENVSVDNWEIIFDTLTAYEPNCRKLIVIDEFQYLGKSNPAFPSIFQKIWDSKLTNTNVMVIISLMEAQTLSYSSPLYGRRTGQIKLKPIPFRYYNEFYNKKSNRDLIPYYSVTGGVPKYIELFQEKGDIFAAIEKHVLSTRSFLYEEPFFLLQSEVSEIGSYFSLIRAIAAGNRRLSAIATVMEVKQTSLTRYLRTLIDLDIIKREVPVTEDNPEKSKRGLYGIQDNFIHFWFKFVYPERSAIESGHAEQAMRKIQSEFIGHVAYVYQDICREKMWQLAAEGALPVHFDRVGRWWDNKNEIDIVALDSTARDIVFCECKYTKEPMGTDVFYALLEKKKAVLWKQNERKEYFAFFSINGYSKSMYELALTRHDLFLFE